MKETEKFEGFGWIQVPRGVTHEFDGRQYVSAEHHQAETVFLIDTVRALAERIDRLKAALATYRRQDAQQRRWQGRQARYEADHLPYQEDDQER